jgi:hypothetical protein
VFQLSAAGHLGLGVEVLIPGNDETQSRLIERTLAGEVVSQVGTRLEAPGVVTYWDVVLAPTFDGAQVIGFVNLVTDATDRVKAYQLLQRRIDAFATIAESMTVDQPIQVTLRSLAQIAARIAGAEACAVIIVDSVTHQLTLFEAAGLSEAYASAGHMVAPRGAVADARRPGTPRAAGRDGRVGTGAGEPAVRAAPPVPAGRHMGRHRRRTA